jgi:hypothetical protein
MHKYFVKKQNKKLLTNPDEKIGPNFEKNFGEKL